MTDFRDILRAISGPVKPDALTRVARFLTAGQVDSAEAEMEPGLVQLADGTVWLVKPDLSMVQVADGGSQPGSTITTAVPFSFDTSKDGEATVDFHEGDLILGFAVSLPAELDGTNATFMAAFSLSALADAQIIIENVHSNTPNPPYSDNVDILQNTAWLNGVNSLWLVTADCQLWISVNDGTLGEESDATSGEGVFYVIWATPAGYDD